MAHFYGTIKGARGEASRLGSKASGLKVVAASWDGAIEVVLDVDSKGHNTFRVMEREWHGSGRNRLIAEGHFLPEQEEEHG